MRKTNFWLLAVSVVVLAEPAFGQAPVLDSLRHLRSFETGLQRQWTTIKLAEYFFYSSRDSSIKYAKEALEWSVENRDRNLEAKARETFGFAVGNSAQALEQTLLALQIYSELNDEAGIASAQNYLGNIFIGLGQLEKSEASFRSALKYYQKAGNEALVARQLGNLGILKRRTGSLDSSIFFLKAAIDLRKKLRDPVAEAEMRIYLARTYADAAQLDSARFHFNSSIKTLRDNYGSIKFLSIGLNELARLEMNAGNTRKAVELARESLRLAEKHGFLLEVRDAWLTISELFDIQNRPLDALSALKTHLAYRDSVAKSENRQLANKVQLEFETRNRDRRIERLEEQNRSETITRRMWTIATASAVLIALLLTLGYRQRAASERFQASQNEKLRKLVLELQKQKEIADNAIKTKTLLIDIAAHDLKNPLQSLLGIARHLQEIHKEDPETSTILKRIENISTVMFEHIARFLMQNENPDPQAARPLESVSLQQIINRLLEETGPQIESKNLAISINTGDHTILSNPRALLEILRNLLSNAVKFSPAHGSISVFTALHENELRIAVRDSGPGFSRDDFKLLFTRKQKGSARPSASENSSGIGLSIAHQLATDLGMRIVAENNANSTGATVALLIPAAKFNQ